MINLHVALIGALIGAILSDIAHRIIQRHRRRVEEELGDLVRFRIAAYREGGVDHGQD